MTSKADLADRGQPDVAVKVAVTHLHAAPAATAFISDSFTDIEAAHRADIASTGYANKPGKESA